VAKREISLVLKIHKFYFRMNVLSFYMDITLVDQTSNRW